MSLFITTGSACFDTFQNQKNHGVWVSETESKIKELPVLYVSKTP
jgi:hypothetical protein